MTTAEAIALGIGIGGVVIKLIEAIAASNKAQGKTQIDATNDKIRSLEVAHHECRKHDDDSHRILYGRLADIDKVVATIPSLTSGLQRVEGRLDALGDRVGDIGEAMARVEARLEGSPAE